MHLGDLRRELFYTPETVGRRLGLSRSAIYARITSGEIAARKFHQRPDCEEPCHCPIRISSIWFETYLQRHAS